MQQQPLASMTVTQDQEDAVLAAVRHIESQLRGLVSLDPGDRQSLPMLSAKCECYARSVIRQLQHHADLVPPGLDVTGALADLATLDRMRKLHIVLEQLLARITDTMAALGSDVMEVAQTGYGVLKLFGDQEMVQSIRKEFGYRHARAAHAPRAFCTNREMRRRETAH